MTVSYRKNPLFTDIGVDASYQSLDIQEHACGLNLGSALISNKKPCLEMVSNSIPNDLQAIQPPTFFWGPSPQPRPHYGSKDGRKKSPARGFTLLELIVVILLLTILLGFAIPAFRVNSLSSTPGGIARQLISLVSRLKIATVEQQSTYTLHLDLDQGRIWVTHEKENIDEKTNNLPSSAWALPEDLRIAQVRLPGNHNHRSGTIDIGFSPQGYSDRALVQLSGSDEPQIEVVIEAFLPTAYIASDNHPPPF